MRTVLTLVTAAASLVGLALASPAEAQTCGGYRWDNPSSSYPAGVQHATFRSPSMNVDVGFNVYEPEEAKTERLPVIYFLHGANGDEGTMVDNVVSWVAARTARGLIRPAILVFANGAVNSGYADSKDGTRRVETSILSELIPHVDAHYRTNACRGQRAISGFSMGGNGALLYAFKHPELFSSVVAYAGALLDWTSLRSEHPETARCMFGDDAAYFDQYSPWAWADKSAAALKAGPRVRMAVGDRDPLRTLDEEMDTKLSALEIPHEFELLPGCGHEHKCLWEAAGDRGVAAHEAAFTPCGAAPEADAGSDAAAPAAPGQDRPDAGPDAPPGSTTSCAATPGTPTNHASWLLLVAGISALALRRRRRAAGPLALLALVACSGDGAGDRAATTHDAAPSDTATGGREVADLEGGSTDGGAPAPVLDGGAAEASSPTFDAAPVGGQVTCGAFKLSGDPASTQGASWTYRATDDGTNYDLTGVLLLPPGKGPFPAVVVSHGKGGQATGYSKTIGLSMREWGLAVIATNYTHAAAPGGAPSGPEGASSANILRAHKARQLLGCVSSVDGGRVAAHGHSMGAFVTAALAGSYPTELRAASHTAGGVSDTGVVNDGIATTTAAVAAQIRAPYQMHHGDKDSVVPLSLDTRLDEILRGAAVTHELHVYPGYDHPAVSLDKAMLERVRAFYATSGVL